MSVKQPTVAVGPTDKNIVSSRLRRTISTRSSYASEARRVGVVRRNQTFMRIYRPSLFESRVATRDKSLLRASLKATCASTLRFVAVVRLASLHDSLNYLNQASRLATCCRKN